MIVVKPKILNCNDQGLKVGGEVDFLIGWNSSAKCLVPDNGPLYSWRDRNFDLIGEDHKEEIPKVAHLNVRQGFGHGII